jgi:hypothetical protein
MCWVLELFFIARRSPWPTVTVVAVRPLQEMEFARDDPSRLKNNMWVVSQPTCRLYRLLFEIFGMGILHTCMAMFIVNSTGPDCPSLFLEAVHEGSCFVPMRFPALSDLSSSCLDMKIHANGSSSGCRSCIPAQRYGYPETDESRRHFHLKQQRRH